MTMWQGMECKMQINVYADVVRAYEQTSIRRVQPSLVSKHSKRKIQNTAIVTDSNNAFYCLARIVHFMCKQRWMWRWHVSTSAANCLKDNVETQRNNKKNEKYAVFVSVRYKMKNTKNTKMAIVLASHMNCVRTAWSAAFPRRPYTHMFTHEVKMIR